MRRSDSKVRLLPLCAALLWALAGCSSPNQQVPRPGRFSNQSSVVPPAIAEQSANAQSASFAPPAAPPEAVAPSAAPAASAAESLPVARLISVNAITVEQTDQGASQQLIPLPPCEPVASPPPTVDSASQQLAAGAASTPEPNAYPIDLPTALQLANAGNYQVLFAREQIRQAWAQAQAARVLWLPSIRAGVDYDKHEGTIQDTAGTVSQVSRGNFYGGFGALTPAAASPAIPGIYANFRTADALFQPLAARQAATARRFAAAAATNDILLQVSLAYLELLRTSADAAIAQETLENARQLADLTGQNAHAGQGLQSDADRATTEMAIRTNDLSRAQVAVRIASAKLAQLLRLDATISLDTAEPGMLPIDLLSPDTVVGELVAQALMSRPELAQNQALVAQAVARMRREQYAVFMPSVLLGASYGAFGGGLGSTISNVGNRLDADAVAYWELRNLGFGEAAARAEARSLVQQANVNRLLAMDVVAREVAEAYASVVVGKGQISTAQQAVSAAVGSHQRNLERILHAQGLPIEVLQSNQALAQAQREYLRSVADYNVAQFTLYRALGWPAKVPQNVAVAPGS